MWRIFKKTLTVQVKEWYVSCKRYVCCKNNGRQAPNDRGVQDVEEDLVKEPLNNTTALKIMDTKDHDGDAKGVV